MPTVQEKKAMRRAFRDADPLGSAVLQSVEFDHPVHRAYRAEEAARLEAAAGNVEQLPQRWDRYAPTVRLSLGSLVYRGIWRDMGEPSEFDGRAWTVQLDDVPEDVVTDRKWVP